MRLYTEILILKVDVCMWVPQLGSLMKKIPQVNFSHKNFSVENNYLFLSYAHIESIQTPTKVQGQKQNH